VSTYFEAMAVAYADDTLDHDVKFGVSRMMVVSLPSLSEPHRMMGVTVRYVSLAVGIQPGCDDEEEFAGIHTADAARPSEECDSVSFLALPIRCFWLARQRSAWEVSQGRRRQARGGLAKHCAGSIFVACLSGVSRGTLHLCHILRRSTCAISPLSARWSGRYHHGQARASRQMRSFHAIRRPLARVYASSMVGPSCAARNATARSTHCQRPPRSIIIV
jgi:hypothetical protein